MERPPPSNRYELKESHAVLAARAILSHQAGDVPPEGKKVQPGQQMQLTISYLRIR